jgi:hypothetical protein
MIIYRFRRGDHVFEGVVEVPDGPTIPPFHTRAAPPEKDGFHAVMRGGWMLVEGPAPRASSPNSELDVTGSVRAERDARLRDTDWLVVKAYELSAVVPSEWVTYRQALRDVPQQKGFPFEIIWPDKPE